MSSPAAKLIAVALLICVLFAPSASLCDAEELPLADVTIGLDPGHQNEADNELEPIAPNSERTKPRMSAGCAGARTGTDEGSINLAVANMLAALLEEEGATVVLTRTDGDVNLSNAERAELMNGAEVDFWLRIHCNSSSRASAHGASTISPTHRAAPAIAAESARLADCVLDALCESCGADKLTKKLSATQAGFNWSNSPVIAVELGYLSNAREDLKLNRRSYQLACAEGIVEGVIDYCMEEP